MFAVCGTMPRRRQALWRGGLCVEWSRGGRLLCSGACIVSGRRQCVCSFMHARDPLCASRALHSHQHGFLFQPQTVRPCPAGLPHTWKSASAAAHVARAGWRAGGWQGWMHSTRMLAHVLPTRAATAAFMPAAAAALAACPLAAWQWAARASWDGASRAAKASDRTAHAVASACTA